MKKNNIYIYIYICKEILRNHTVPLYTDPLMIPLVGLQIVVIVHFAYVCLCRWDVKMYKGDGRPHRMSDAQLYIFKGR